VCSIVTVCQQAVYIVPVFGSRGLLIIRFVISPTIMLWLWGMALNVV